MEDRFGFHGKPPSPEQAEQALEELEATLERADQGARGEPMASELIDAAEPQTEPIATRQAYGDALVDARREHPTRSSRSTPTSPSRPSRSKFGKQFPERFFNVGAAEANMMSMACGLAATGKVPYASTFAIFATGRAYDQVRLGIAHNELKVRIGASHGGVSLGEDGASHQMIEDIALMRAMPKMQVVVPADYNQAYRR